MGRVSTELKHLPRCQETTVSTIQPSTIYPRTEQIIPVRTQDVLGGSEVLILPEESLEGFAVASLNPVPTSGIAYMKVVNWTDQPLTIKAGQRVAT